MTTAQHEGVWLDTPEGVSLSDLSRVCGMSAQEVEELVEYGALIPLSPQRSELWFSADCLMPLRAAGKMRIDYDLDIFTVVLLLEGLQRIEILERRIRHLEVFLPMDAAQSHGIEPEPASAQGSFHRSVPNDS
ncbi:MAG: chaperone modulator CbpM [Polaromonas sp.]|nr:chaperone modulator CbpM [Polaromonas sp.]